MRFLNATYYQLSTLFMSRAPDLQLDCRHAENYHHRDQRFIKPFYNTNGNLVLLEGGVRGPHPELNASMNV